MDSLEEPLTLEKHEDSYYNNYFRMPDSLASCKVIVESVE